MIHVSLIINWHYWPVFERNRTGIYLGMSRVYGSPFHRAILQQGQWSNLRWVNGRGGLTSSSRYDSSTALNVVNILITMNHKFFSVNDLCLEVVLAHIGNLQVTTYCWNYLVNALLEKLLILFRNTSTCKWKLEILITMAANKL